MNSSDVEQFFVDLVLAQLLLDLLYQVRRLTLVQDFG